MEEDNKEVVSTQKALLSSHDPGWNDPPSWALSSQKPIGTPTKRLLNKRVAFPLNSKSDSLSSSPLSIPPTGNVPPPAGTNILTTAPHKPIVAPTATHMEDKPLAIEINKEEALKEILDNLHSSMERLESSKAEEIQKRLDRMEIMWNENKLNSVVHKTLLEISQALKEDDVKKADQLHISLMMNNASCCSSWIPGVRQLITETRNRKM